MHAAMRFIRLAVAPVPVPQRIGNPPRAYACRQVPSNAGRAPVLASR